MKLSAFLAEQIGKCRLKSLTSLFGWLLPEGFQNVGPSEEDFVEQIRTEASMRSRMKVYSICDK